MAWKLAEALQCNNNNNNNNNMTVITKINDITEHPVAPAANQTPDRGHRAGY